ncbi:DNA primase [Bacillus methanolicus]|uniref:YrrS family protein n=1 Tax=Bacillus methanolicus TaxID=1471 RepID=UPI00200D88E6|nr:YrrS family protein [Bacillus methanolicus]UQD52835.1 DNA primase [Bacillus methanolicus]
MKGGFENEYVSRAKIREKRRKTNLILNSLIGIVIILIIIVSFNIFFGGNDEKAAGKQEHRTENIKEKHDGAVSKRKKNNEYAEYKKESQNESDSEKESDQLSAKKDDSSTGESEPVVKQGGSSPDVKETIVNPNWKPVGTSQAGEHPAAVYDESSVDWQEMLRAISYATGIEQSNMTVWFLGNNGPNKSVGTVSSKSDKRKYRVYIEWVDGQGWKPVKVEELQR